MVNVMGTAMGMVKKRRSRYLAIYTIKDYDKEFQLYRLAFPNDEVLSLKEYRPIVKECYA